MRRFAALLLLAGCTPEVSSYGSALCRTSGPTIVAPTEGAVLYEAMDVRSEVGHQSDVVVSSALSEGAELSLSFLTDAGVLLPWPKTVRVDAAGAAVFEAVSFPEAASRLQVHHASSCGLASDEVEVEVLTPLTCAMELVPEGDDRPAYRPRTTINLRNDGDWERPDIQLGVVVETLPGANVSVWERGGGAPLWEAEADASGRAGGFVDLDDGERDLEARCSVPNPARQLTSRPARLFVDGVRPDCRLLGFVEGQVITASEDLDDGLDGTQLYVEAQIGGDDASRSPLRFEVTAGLATFAVTGSQLVDGTSGATVMLWDPGPNRLSVTASDRAGNECIAQLGLMYGTP